MDSKAKHIAYNMIGVFVKYEYLEYVLDEIYKDDRTYNTAKKNYSLPEIFVAWMAVQDYSNVDDHIKFIIVDSKELSYTPKQEGYIIGVELNRFPEHFSIKRMKVDVRNLLERFSIVTQEHHPETVKLFELCIEVGQEDV